MKSLTIALCMVLALAGGAGAVELVHNPVLAGTAGQDLALSASLVGAPSGAHVRVYYRARGQEIYRSFEMQGSLGGLMGSIPSDSLDADGVEYYLEAATYGNGGKTVVATYPRVNPALSPVEVVVRTDRTPPELQVLSPSDGDNVDSSRPVVTLTWGDADSGLDLATAQLQVDGKTISLGKTAQVQEGLFTWLPEEDLSDGRHLLAVSIKDRAGNLGKATWSFTVTASGNAKPAASKGWVSSGTLGVETSYGAVLQAPANQASSLPFSPYGTNRGDLEAITRSDTDTLDLKIHVTDEERAEAQPLNRYTASWTNLDQGSLTLGDIANTSFTELTLWQLPELRGVQADLRSGPLDGNHSRFIGVWGQTERAVESGATLPGGVTYTSTAVFSQYLYGARWESEGPHFGWNWNAVTINDDFSSLRDGGTQNPMYNTTLSTDAKLAVPEIWLCFRGEAALDWDMGSPDLTGPSLGGADRVNGTWDAKPLGTKLSVEYRDLGGSMSNLMQVVHDKVDNSVPNAFPVPGGYSSMGNSGLLSDYRGFESSLEQHLFNNQVNFTGNLNQWRDNLQNYKPVTTDTFFYSVNLGVAPVGWPSAGLSYSRTRADGQPADWGNGPASPEAITSTTGGPADIVTSTLSLNLGNTFVLKEARSLALNLAWTDIALRDNDVLKVSPDMDGWNLVLTAFYSQGVSSLLFTAGAGGSASPATLLNGTTVTATTLGASNGQNLSLGAHWTRQWLTGSPLSSNLGWDLNSSDTSSDAASGPATKQDSLRNTFSANGGYKLTPTQRVSLTLAWAEQQSSVDSGTGAVNDSLGELDSDLRYDISF